MVWRQTVAEWSPVTRSDVDHRRTRHVLSLPDHRRRARSAGAPIGTAEPGRGRCARCPVMGPRSDLAGLLTVLVVLIASQGTAAAAPPAAPPVAGPPAG